MKRVFILFLAIVFLTDLNAQEQDTVKNWKTGGNAALTFSQVSLTNWAAGGQNSMSVNGLLNLLANYKKGNSSWDNTLDLGYGFLKQGDANLVKSDDKIDFSSKYGQKASKNWYYSALFTFKSQFTDGYNYPNDSVVISRFFAPAYFFLSVGMDYKPNDKFSLFISPLTGKITMVNDQDLSDQGAFGVEPGKKSRSEYGAFVKMQYTSDIMENVGFRTKLDLFSNYSENPGNIDVNWEVMIAMKINKYLSANINTQLVYDDDINAPGKNGPRVQFKEVFGLGFAYKF